MPTLLHRVLIACLLCLLPAVGMAQNGDKKTFAPRWMIGPTAGINLSQVVFAPAISQGLKRGMDVGVVMRADVEPYAGVWLEMDWSQRGWQDYYEQLPDVYFERTLTCVNVPFMSHFMIGRGSLKVTIDAGPHFGYWLADTQRSNVIKGEHKVHTEHHDQKLHSKIIWGLGGGLGAEKHLKRWVVGGRLSFYRGLGDLFDNSRAAPFGTSSEQVFSAKAYILYVF